MLGLRTRKQNTLYLLRTEYHSHYVWKFSAFWNQCTFLPYFMISCILFQSLGDTNLNTSSIVMEARSAWYLMDILTRISINGVIWPSSLLSGFSFNDITYPQKYHVRQQVHDDHFLCRPMCIECHQRNNHPYP